MRQEKEDLRKAYEQTILQSQIEIQEQTLRTISQEIHDNIGQVLSLVSLNVSTIPTTDLEKRTFTRSLVSKAIADLRDLSKSLNPERIQIINFEDAIAHELKMMEKSGNFTTSFTVENKIRELAPDKKIILFRMIQEVFNNIIKHAKATRIDIIFSMKQEKSTITIKDNGIGFIADENTFNGIGLSNIKKRAEMISAIFEISSVLKQGTTVKLILKN
ncbi:MAG: histidine kinase [Bacteroidetes bacterium]|nr:histidine kinase [Bacteroidota bacterium]